MMLDQTTIQQMITAILAIVIGLLGTKWQYVKNALFKVTLKANQLENLVRSMTHALNILAEAEADNKITNEEYHRISESFKDVLEDGKVFLRKDGLLPED